MSKYLECLAELGVGGAHPGGLQLTKKALETLEVNKQTSVLDVGCGTGQTAAYIAEHYGCNVSGIDSHQVMVDKANQRFKESGLPINCLQGYVESLPFEDGTFDYILSESVLVFTNLPVSISEIKRVLKPSGKLIAVEMVRELPISNVEIEKIQNFYGFTDILTEEEWSQKFLTAGFKNIEFQKYEIPIEVNMDQAPEFWLSENLDERYFEILMEHQLLLVNYADSLGFRIITCA